MTLPSADGQSAGKHLGGRAPRLALSMIVRDASRTLARCLESVRGVVDEVVIADTGSSDGTEQIARGLGARVFSIPWPDDFARARNQCLDQVQAGWVLSLDADEMLDPSAAKMIPPLLQAGPAGYLVPIRNYVLSANERLWDRPAKPNASSFEAARQYPAYVEHENVRLFRRVPQIRFTGRVHESVGPSITERGHKLGRAGFAIHHFGMVADAETRARKNRLYRELGLAKVREMPNNAQAHLELGLVEFDNFHEDHEALRCFERACELNPQFAVAWFFRGMTHLRLQEYEKARACLNRAEQTGANSNHLAEAQGDACYNLGDFEAARRYYHRAIAHACVSASLESKLGLVEVRLGDPDGGLRRLRRAVERSPGSGEIYDRLITAAVSLGNLAEAAALAEHKLANADPSAESFLRAASIHARLADWNRVTALLSEGVARFPAAAKLRQAWEELQAKTPGTQSAH